MPSTEQALHPLALKGLEVRLELEAGQHDQANLAPRVAAEHPRPTLQARQSQNGPRIQGRLGLQRALGIEDPQLALGICHDKVALKLQHVCYSLGGWQELRDFEAGEVQKRQTILPPYKQVAAKDVDFADGAGQALFDRVRALELLGCRIHLPQANFSIITSGHQHTLVHGQRGNPLPVALKHGLRSVLCKCLHLAVPKAYKEPTTAEEQGCGRVLQLHLKLGHEIILARGAQLGLPAFHGLVVGHGVDALLSHGHGLNG